MDAGDFNDRAVMVVGSATGIGRATAEVFAAAGARLALFDVNPAVKETADAIRKAQPDSEVFDGRCDVTSEGDCAAAVAATVERYGSVDVLAMVAGVIQEADEVAELPLKEWNRVINVNLTGTFLICQAAARAMKENNGGSIVNVASFFGHSGQAYFAAYCASKAGVMIVTHSMAKELGDFGIRVNAICPGYTSTELHYEALRAEAAKRSISFEEMQETQYAEVPLKKAGSPVDIANGIMFLASDNAAYINGASLDVNGGVLNR